MGLIGTNPWVLLFGAFLGLTVAFGGGYYTATKVFATAQSSAVENAVAAQADRDKKAIAAANAESARVAAADAAHGQKVDVIVKTISEPNAPTACNLPADVAKKITDAGAY